MASMRTAAVLRLCALALFACPAAPALSSPLLPPDPPRIDAIDQPVSIAPSATDDAAAPAATNPRRALADFAMKLRNIAYRHGGRELATGFDCSGFVRYVFEHSIGFELPSNSISQFGTGSDVDRKALRMGDLVFFRTRGRHVSHVGIYLDNGLFIHAPSRGKRVRIDHLDASYWSRRYAGARRPDGLS
jgi:cell wall-associated NlpC family hydrolase